MTIRVMPFPNRPQACVKLQYKGYEISISAESPDYSLGTDYTKISCRLYSKDKKGIYSEEVTQKILGDTFDMEKNQYDVYNVTAEDLHKIFRVIDNYTSC